MAVNFNRLLCLLSNEVMVKSRDVVGSQVLSDPELVSVSCVYSCMCTHSCAFTFVKIGIVNCMSCHQDSTCSPVVLPFNFVSIVMLTCSPYKEVTY